jgi:cysteine desulfurase / selenocysteine lyase
VKHFFKISVIVFSGFFSMYSMYPIKVTKFDGGEYCNRIHGSSKDSHALKHDVFFAQNEPEGDNVPCLQGNMDFVALRKQFAIFQTVAHNHRLIYFDSAATAQMPQQVLDAMVEYYQSYKSNVGRGLYSFAERATERFEKARAKIASFIGAQKEEIIFTSGATAGINLVAHIWAEHHINSGDEIIISQVEHNANFLPWQQLAKKKDVVLNMAPLNFDGVVDVEALKAMLSNKTKLVAVTHQSNILGTCNDVAAIAHAAHAVGAKVLVDAAQSIAHQNIDVKRLDCDFLAFSGHKLFGPTGVGVLFIKQSLVGECSLHNFGGGMVYSVTPEHSEFKSAPHCFEPGTQAIAQVIGLGAAIDFIKQYINFDQALDHETNLARSLALQLQTIPDIRLLSPVPQVGQHNSMVTFTSNIFHSYDIAQHLNKYGIAVRSGYHCAQPYHDKIGSKSSVRVSFSVYNTQEEVDFFVACLRKLYEGQ